MIRLSNSILALALGVTVMVLVATPAVAGCNMGVEMGEASSHCMKSGSETNSYIAGHSDHTYSIRPACGVGGNTLCADPATCTIDGHDGYLFNVYQDADPQPLDWQA